MDNINKPLSPDKKKEINELYSKETLDKRGAFTCPNPERGESIDPVRKLDGKETDKESNMIDKKMIKGMAEAVANFICKSDTIIVYDHTIERVLTDYLKKNHMSMLISEIFTPRELSELDKKDTGILDELTANTDKKQDSFKPLLNNEEVEELLNCMNPSEKKDNDRNDNLDQNNPDQKQYHVRVEVTREFSRSTGCLKECTCHTADVHALDKTEAINYVRENLLHNYINDPDDCVVTSENINLTAMEVK